MTRVPFLLSYTLVALLIFGVPVLAVTITDSDFDGSANYGESVMFDLANAHTYTGVVSGAGNTLTKTGVGNLTLNSAQTYTGATSISGGTLTTGNLANFGNTSGITLSNGATLKYTGAGDSLTPTLTVNGSGTVDYHKSTTDTLTLTIAGDANANLTLYGNTSHTSSSGVSTFYLNSTGYTGTISLTGGKWRIDTTNSISAIYLNDGTLMNQSSNSSCNVGSAATVTLGPQGGSIRVGHALNAVFTINGKITGAGALTITGDQGIASLANSANDYTGGTIIGGTFNGNASIAKLRLDADNALGTGVVSFVQNNSANYLDLNGHSITTTAISGLSSTGAATVMNTDSSDSAAATLTLEVASTDAYTYAGSFSGGTIDIVKNGTGTQMFKSLNSKGNVTVNAGSMIYDLGATGTGTLGTVSGDGTFQLKSGTLTVDSPASAATGLHLVIDEVAQLTVNTKYSGAANHIEDTTFSGAGTLVFNAGNLLRMNFRKPNTDFTGTFYFKNGNLSAQSSSGSGGVDSNGIVRAFGSSTIVLESAVLMTPGSSLEYQNDVQVKGNGGARAGFGSNRVLTISGTISDYPGSTGVFNVSNDQGIILINNGSNTYSGGTIIGSEFHFAGSGGYDTTLKLGENADTGSKTPLGTGPVAFHEVSDHETVFDLNGQSVTIYGLNNNAAEMDHGTLKNTGAACTLTLSVGEGLDYAYGGSIAESGNAITLLKTGSGKQTLSGDISNLNIEIQDGTINTMGTAFASSAAVQSGGTLRLTTDGTTMDSLSAGTITLPEDMVLSLEFLDGAPRAAGEFQILTQTDPFTYTAEYLTSLLPESQSYWTLRVDGNAVFASVSANAIPEPAAWFLLLLGTGLLSMTHFKRKKRV